MSKMQKRLDQYYDDVGITPVTGRSYEGMFRRFRCPKKRDCRSACCPEGKEKSEGYFSPRIEGVCVSKWYENGKYEGCRVPRIVVISLSVPKPESNGTGSESPPEWNPHWRGTTTTVRSLLHPFVELDPAGSRDAKSTEIIEGLFVHLRTAKCFSGLYGNRQEPWEVYENCGAYLTEEARILKPDVVVTQGHYAHEMAAKHVFEEGAGEKEPENVRGIGTSIARIAGLKKNKRQRVYWLQSYFPYGRYFYSRKHAGAKVLGEKQVVGAMWTNLVLYGRAIESFLSDR